MAGFVSFFPEIISEGSAIVSGLFHGVESAVAGQAVVDAVNGYAKRNPDSKVGKLLNSHKAHTPRVGCNCGKRTKKKRVG